MLAVPAALQAQRLVTREAGLDVVVVAARRTQFAGGGSLWWRVAPRTRMGGMLAGGVSNRSAAIRGEVVGHFLLSPDATRGVAPYAGGGLAFSRGPAEGEHLLIVLGAEARPGTRGGWVLEVGLGGGVRVAAGWRWRSPRRPVARP